MYIKLKREYNNLFGSKTAIAWFKAETSYTHIATHCFDKITYTYIEKSFFL